MKTIRHLFTVLMLLCSAVAFAHDFEVDGIYYNILSKADKTVEVTFKGSSYSEYSNEYTGNVVIPESVAYNGTTYSVTSIGDWVFFHCTGLTSVEIPNSVTSIGECAFFYCSGLTSVEIPNSVTSIGNSAFSRCSGLTSVEIPNSVTSIGYYAFDGCTSLSSVEIPYSVTSIGDGAFDGCTSLSSVEIPYSVTSIGDYAFESCSGLTSIEIPNSVTSIGDYAFESCSGLTSIEIPNSVTSIGSSAFGGCTSLSSVDFNAKNCTTMGSGFYFVFSSCTALSTVTFGENVKTIPDYAFYNCTGLTSVVISDGVTSIGSSAFSGCTGLTCIEIPNSVTFIGNWAFSDCYGLASVVIGNSVTSIGGDAFYNCSGLTSVVIGNSVTSIGDYAFAYCYGLASIEIPNSVTSIGWGAFVGCSGLTSINSLIPAEDLFSIDSYVFSGVDKNACTLCVPRGAKDTYASTAGWSEFKNIVELGRSTFKATFRIDGEEIAVYDIKEGDAIVYPDVDEKEGYTLVWTPYVDIMPSENIVIEGTFIANTYTITYTVDNEIFATDSVVYGNEIVLREEPAKEGYTFSGWSEAPQTMPAKDIVIEGTFSVNSYTITFIVDGEVYKSMDVEYGAGTPTIEQPTKDGRKFSGWSEIPSTMPARDVVIEGQFCYTVVFMVDGKYYSSFAIYYGDEIPAPSGIPNKEGHTFVEWGEFPETMPARDMTIHAIFSVDKYQLMFIIDGEVYETLFVEYGSEIEYPQMDGYIITWETENLPQTMPAENLIIIGTSALDTAVECVNEDNERIIYTLDGHRILDVENIEKGVYIINGKKVLVK